MSDQTVETLTLNEDQVTALSALVEKNESIAMQHSKLRTDFLALELKLMQAKAQVEQQLRDGCSEALEANGIENSPQFRLDIEDGVLQYAVPVVTETAEADTVTEEEIVEAEA